VIWLPLESVIAVLSAVALPARVETVTVPIAPVGKTEVAPKAEPAAAETVTVASAPEIESATVAAAFGAEHVTVLIVPEGLTEAVAAAEPPPAVIVTVPMLPTAARPPVAYPAIAEMFDVPIARETEEPPEKEAFGVLTDTVGKDPIAPDP